MHFCDREYVSALIKGKSVAIVGSGPGALQNDKGLVDSHDLVCRVNNYKLFPATGFRTDIHYSFFGQSIKKTPGQLKGVKLCMCKCPNAKFMESSWHTEHKKLNGIDFRYIYEKRRDWWFCPTYVPSVEQFMAHFELLGKRIPTTGFAALLDILSYEPQHIYLTGFDFFQSGIHNVNEKWRPGDPNDPIGHDPSAERAWFAANAGDLPITMDAALTAAMTSTRKAPVRQSLSVYSRPR